MRRALAGRDLAAAISVALAYRAVAPQDDPGSSRWNRKIWALATAQEDAGAHVSKARLTRTLALLSPEFPGERKMTRRSFEQWIQDSAWKPASSAPTAVVIHKAQLKLTIDSHEPGAPALNARSLGRINDAFTVWCHCNGTTYTVDGSTGLPLSIARVNPWLMRSEVIEMPQPAGGQVPDSSAGPERADKDSPRRETQVRRRSTTG